MKNFTPATRSAFKSSSFFNTEGIFEKYLKEIKKFPVLGKEEEYTLAKKWTDQGDKEAAQKLITSHLRLVAKIAAGYKGYGLPLGDIIAEGNIGLMHAVRQFDPEKGFRLSTYALWWIKAMIQEYILKSWSLVKIGTTASQKRLFFSLKRLKTEIKEAHEGDLTPAQTKEIAEKLKVSIRDVVEMEQRVKGQDFSLNIPLDADGENSYAEWQDGLVDESPSPEEYLIQKDEFSKRRNLLKCALGKLSPREAEIITLRRLNEPPITLETLSEKFHISKERIRQIELTAFGKLQNFLIKYSSTISTNSDLLQNS